MSNLDWATGFNGGLNDDGVTPPLKQDHQVQGTKAWHEWRNKGLGSSDAAVLLGWSPWKKIEELFLEKQGKWKPVFGSFQLSAMERGKQLEPYIRTWYEKKVNAFFTEASIEHPQYPFMRTSFDGHNSDFVNEDGTRGKFIEIKAPNAKDHELALNGEIPDKYIVQMQWQALCSGYKYGDYVSYGSDKTYAIVLLRADDVMQAELLRRALLFYEVWQSNGSLDAYKETFKKWVRPMGGTLLLPETLVSSEPLEEEEVETIVEEQGIEKLVSECLEAQAAQAKAKARYEILTDKLKKILGNKKEMSVGEADFGFTPVKGQVDYSVIPELIGINLDQFRKPATQRFYFERKKK